VKLLVPRARAAGAATACLGLALLAAACGILSGSTSSAPSATTSPAATQAPANGIADKPPAQIVAAATKALASARSVHVKGTVRESGEPLVQPGSYPKQKFPCRRPLLGGQVERRSPVNFRDDGAAARDDVGRITRVSARGVDAEVVLEVQVRLAQHVVIAKDTAFGERGPDGIALACRGLGPVVPGVGGLAGAGNGHLLAAGRGPLRQVTAQSTACAARHYCEPGVSYHHSLRTHSVTPGGPGTRAAAEAAARSRLNNLDPRY
jgi:hypothetical protein